MPPKQKQQDETPSPAPPVEVEAPDENPDAVVEVNADQVPPRYDLMDFKRSGPEYDLSILDAMVSNGRGDLAKHRDSIVTAIDEADNRGHAIAQFKDHFEMTRILDMPLLNEAVNDGQVTARGLRGSIWKTIKALPHR